VSPSGFLRVPRYSLHRPLLRVLQFLRTHAVFHASPPRRDTTNGSAKFYREEVYAFVSPVLDDLSSVRPVLHDRISFRFSETPTRPGQSKFRVPTGQWQSYPELETEAVCPRAFTVTAASDSVEKPQKKRREVRLDGIRGYNMLLRFQPHVSGLCL